MSVIVEDRDDDGVTRYHNDAFKVVASAKSIHLAGVLKTRDIARLRLALSMAEDRMKELEKLEAES